MKDSTGVGKNPSTMAAEEQPDFAALAVERVRLERREPELAEQLQRALHRAGAFPSEFGLREVAEIEARAATARRPSRRAQRANAAGAAAARIPRLPLAGGGGQPDRIAPPEA